MKARLLLLAVVLVASCVVTSASAQGHSDRFEISGVVEDQRSPDAAYNPNDGEYLVVWADHRNGEWDIYGQFVREDGTHIEGNFPIVVTEGDQSSPCLDFDAMSNRYLVAFTDFRNGEYPTTDGDIRGIFVGSDGSLITAPTSESDGTFRIRHVDERGALNPSIAFNDRRSLYLVVWSDDYWGLEDEPFLLSVIAGRRITADGDLLDGFTLPYPNNYDDHCGSAEVDYGGAIDEWLVVYNGGLGVYAQRIDPFGRFISRDGLLDGDCFRIAGEFLGGAYDRHVRFNDGAGSARLKRSEAVCECEAVWVAQIYGDFGYVQNLSGQRIAFLHDGQNYVATFIDAFGDVGGGSHPIASGSGDKEGVGIAYSPWDNEFLVAWGDDRNGASTDLYCQRMWISDVTNDLHLIDDERVDLVDPEVNIPVEVSGEKTAGSTVCVAHGSGRNEFLLVYTYEDPLLDNGSDLYARRFYGSPMTSVDDGLQLPTSFEVLQNYPNPFNPETTIRFSLPETGTVRVAVFDLTGRRIRKLLEGAKPAGLHAVVWDGTDGAGHAVNSGMYIFEVWYNREVVTRKMSLIR